jgi:hypothetical protein
LMIYFPSQNGMISVWGNPSSGTFEKQIIPPTLPNPQKFNRNKNYFLQKLKCTLGHCFFGTCNKYFFKSLAKQKII